MKQYKIKVTPKLMKELKYAWKEVKQANDKYWSNIRHIEDNIRLITGVNIEIFYVDGDLVGIGEAGRDMRLVTREELE